MKTKFNNSEIGHAWFHQSNDTEGSNANGSMYFNDGVIYSYGSHFPIARKVDNVVMFTTRSYSNTTAKQMHHVSRAIPDNVTRFDVHNPEAQTKESHMANVEQIKETIRDTLKSAARSRKYTDSLMARAERLRTNANEYIAHFKLGRKIPALPVDLEALKASIKAADKKKKADAKKSERAAIKENQIKIERWLQGETTVSIPSSIRKVYMRVNDDTIQTSQGVRFPVADALRAYKLIKRVMSTGKAFRTNGTTIELGQYNIDLIKTDGTVIAGCHTVEFDQIERCAVELGINSEAAA